MSQTVKLTLSTLLRILGRHGVFLVILIVAFKLFLLEAANYDCPCDWSVGYGTIVFVFPSLTSYAVAFFAYFRDDDNSVPWKVLKKFYELKFACHQYDERTYWDSHAEFCIRCRILKRDWPLVKIAVTAVLSFLYPLVWLSLSFLQGHYYVCTKVGPSRETLEGFCSVKVQKPDEYDQAYGLAVIRAKSIGTVMFVCTLFFVGLFFIFYGELENYLLKKYDWPSTESGANLQVLVSVLPGRSPGSETSVSSHGNRETSVTSIPEGAEMGVQFSDHQPVADGSKAIRINLSHTFVETLQGCIQDGVWEGIEVRCTQQEEGRSRQESIIPFRLPSRVRRQQQRTGEHTYESLPQLS